MPVPTLSATSPLYAPPSAVGRHALRDALRAVTSAVVLDPDAADFDAAVLPWNRAARMAPALAVAVRSADQVAEVVRFARERGLLVGVQGTGHGAAEGLAGDVLVCTQGLDECTVHADGWARVGAGVKWSRVVPAAAEFGLAPLNGSTSDVGVVGYTTGGGLGPIARTFGAASDRVRAFDVVTGDGVVRRVTATDHPDLFWGLRGGKGIAGIVTAIEFDLVPLASFYGGAVWFAAEHIPAVVHAWRTWVDDLPEAATTSLAIAQLPPLPGIPEALAGRMTVAVRFAWVGDPQDGEAALAPIRAAAPALIDGVGELPYTAVDAVHSDPVEPLPSSERAGLLRSFPSEAADALLSAAGPGSGSPQVVVEVRHLGGAIARPGASSSAFCCSRSAGFTLFAAGIAGIPGLREHGDALLGALAPWTTGAVLPNFNAAADPQRLRLSYDADTLGRLADLVATYDPDGVLVGGRLLAAAAAEDGRSGGSAPVERDALVH